MIHGASDSEFNAAKASSEFFTEDISENAPNIDIAFFTDERICGKGATCVVYQMINDGIHVAVKRLLKEYLCEPTHIAGFRKEYNIGKQLKHDALPVYRYLKDEPEEVYIVMEYIDGTPVSEFAVSEEGIRYFSSPDNVRRFLTQLVDVVGYLHRKGVIHCDIKPANIMMRHTDRHLILIDLDKAYSDSLDRSTGGTRGFSDLLNKDKKPTVQKDFTAIGKVLDFIAECTPHFPRRQFKRFRKECDNPTTTPEQLLAALRPQSRKPLWASVGILCLLILSGIGYTLYRSSLDKATPKTEPKTESSAIPSLAEESEKEPSDAPSKASKEMEASSQSTQSPTSAQDGRQIRIADFDSRMSDFIQETGKSLELLSTGSLTDRQIRTMISKATESYTSAYSSILSDYKAEYPDADGIDVELAVARASEKSRAAKLLERITSTARDTIVARHPVRL